MKHKLCLVFLVLLSLLLYGCKQKDYTVHFKEELVIDYNSNDSPLTLIESIGDIKVTKDMIKDDAIVIDNFKISCEAIDTHVEQNYIVIYKTNDTELPQIKKQVYVKDISAPEISLKKDEVTIFENQISKFNINEYVSIKDNYDKNPHVEVNADKTIKDSGKYIISIIAEDLNKNQSKKEFTLIVKENEVKKANSEDEPNTNNSTQSSTQSEKPNSSINSSGSSTTNKNNHKESSNDSKPATKKYASKKFLFGEIYEYNGQRVECNIDNVADISKKYLLDSGKSGECIPLMQDGLYIGMQVNIKN